MAWKHPILARLCGNFATNSFSLSVNGVSTSGGSLGCKLTAYTCLVMALYCTYLP